MYLPAPGPRVMNLVLTLQSQPGHYPLPCATPQVSVFGTLHNSGGTTANFYRRPEQRTNTECFAKALREPVRFPGLHPSPLGDLGVGEDVTENSPQHEKALVRDRHRRSWGGIGGPSALGVTQYSIRSLGSGKAHTDCWAEAEERAGEAKRREPSAGRAQLGLQGIKPGEAKQAGPLGKEEACGAILALTKGARHLCTLPPLGTSMRI